MALAATVTLAGQVIIGAVASLTVIVKVQVAELLAASVAVKVTVWLPMTVVPVAGFCVLPMLAAAVQLSLAVAEVAKLVIVNWQLALAETVVLAGQAIVGAVWSATVTTNVQVFELPAASVARSVTVRLPRFSKVPAAGVWVLVGEAVQLSEAVAKLVKLASEDWQLAFAATVVLAGQAIVGKVWSATLTVKEQVAVLLFASLAVSVTT